MHYGRMRQVAVSENDLLNLVPMDDLFQIGLRKNRNAVRIDWSAQRLRIASILDARNLRGRKPRDLLARIVTKADVEGVKISSSGT